MSFSIWSDDHLAAIAPDDEALLAAGAVGDVVVAITDRPSAPPPWQLFVRDVLGVPGFGSAGRAQGAVVFCAVEGPAAEAFCWIAYSFGYASHALRRRALEPRFGLIVALNRIALAHEADPDDRARGLLRQASYRTLGPYSYQAGYRAARDTPLESFRMDRLADLLSAAGGRTGGNDPGQVFGARSLKTRDTVDSVASLLGLATEAITDYRAQHYRADFGFVDHMVPVYDDAVEEALRAQLFDEIVSAQDNIDVLLPDDLVPFEDERAICYIVRPGEPTRLAYDVVLTVEMIGVMVRDEGVQALDHELRFCDADRQVIAHAPILVHEAAVQTEEPVGTTSVNAAVAEIPISDIPFPCYLGGPEAAWNTSVAR